MDIFHFYDIFWFNPFISTSGLSPVNITSSFNSPAQSLYKFLLHAPSKFFFNSDKTLWFILIVYLLLDVSSKSLPINCTSAVWSPDGTTPFHCTFNFYTDTEPVVENEVADEEHNYMQSYSSLVLEIKELEKQIAYLQTEIATLQSQKHPLTVANVIDNEQKMLMYTSLKPQMFRIIDSTLQRFPLVYVDGWTPSAFSRTDQLFMTLMKLKLNCPFLDLAERFCTSKATIHNIIITHVFALHEVFFEGMMENNIPSLLKCKASMPASFGDFNCCRLVIDATEVTQDVPGQDMTAQSQTYSSYKNRHTVKSVTGVAPNGAVVYVSKLYPGSTSDVAIVKHSNMLAKLSPGDMILADKGFTIHSILPQGIHLNIPPFLKDKGQYTPAEVQVCRKIARSRIHVERVNERIKNFEILSHIPQQFRHISTKIFQVCAMLVNFQNPMIAEIANNYSFDQ